MGNTTYEVQAQRIEATLAAQNINGRIWQATVTPRFVRFDLTVASGTKLSRVTNLEEEVALTLGVQSVRIERDNGVILVEVPLDTPRRITLADVQTRMRGDLPRPMTAVLGIDEADNPLLLRIDSPDVAHILIAGTTGSGKTELLRTITASLLLRNRAGHLALVLLDPKGAKLAPFADLNQTRLHAVQPAEMTAALGYAVDEMDRRPIGALPHILVVIDELADLLMTTAATGAADLLLRLTQRGREHNVHVVAATQRPAAALVGGMVKANFPTRIVGSVTSTEDAKVATGLPATGAERLLGRGDMMLIAKGNIIRFQAALAGEGELAALQVDNCRRSLGRRLQAALPEWAGGWVGGNARPPEPATATASGLALAHPLTHPPAPLALEAARAAQASRTRTRLADRYSQAELYRAYVESDASDGNGPNRKRACESLYGYSDTNTLALLNAAIARFEAAPEEEVLQ